MEKDTLIQGILDEHFQEFNPLYWDWESDCFPWQTLEKEFPDGLELALKEKLTEKLTLLRKQHDKMVIQYQNKILDLRWEFAKAVNH